MDNFSEDGPHDIGSMIRGFKGGEADAVRIYSELTHNRKSTAQKEEEERRAREKEEEERRLKEEKHDQLLRHLSEHMEHVEHAIDDVAHNQEEELAIVKNIDRKLDTVISKITEESAKLIAALFDVTEVTTPSAFVILNQKLEPKADLEDWLELDGSGLGFKLSEKGEEVKEKAEKYLHMANRASNWAGRLAKVTKSVVEAIDEKGVGGAASAAVDAAVKEMFDIDELWLYLVDELTGKLLYRFNEAVRQCLTLGTCARR